MYNIKNLITLYGGAKSYDICKTNQISKTMKEYKNKKLKTNVNKLVTNQKQAIAIALSQVQNTCKYNLDDTKKLLIKVTNDLNNSDKKIVLSNIIEIKNAIKLLAGNKKQINDIKKLLWNKIINAYQNNEILNKNIWDEIKKINELN